MDGWLQIQSLILGAGKWVERGIAGAPHLDRNHLVFLTQRAKTDVGLGQSGSFINIYTKSDFFGEEILICI